MPADPSHAFLQEEHEEEEEASIWASRATSATYVVNQFFPSPYTFLSEYLLTPLQPFCRKSMEKKRECPSGPPVQTPRR